MTHNLLALALVGLAAAGSLQSQRLEVVPIVGHWLEHTDGGEPIVTVDSTKWDKKSAADPLAIARQLFKEPGVDFATNATSADAFPIAAARSIETFSAGKARVQFKLIAGPSDHIAGLMFDLRPSGEYLVVRYNTKDGNVAFWKYANGARARVASGDVHVQLPVNVWHTIELQVADRTLTGIVNGQLRLAHTLERPVSGRVGFWAKRDSVTAFRGLRIE